MGLSGCTKKSIDDSFIESYTYGLEKRWELTELDKGHILNEDNYKRYIRAELSEISEYDNKGFEDVILAKFCNDYVRLLNQELDSLDSFTSDSWRTEWNQLQDERARLIYINCEVLKPRFSNEKNRNKYCELIFQGKVLPDVQNMMEDICFSRKDENSFYAKVNNTTGENIGYFGINVKIIDENNESIGTTGTGVKNWERDEEKVFTIATSKEVEKVVIDSITYVARSIEEN